MTDFFQETTEAEVAYTYTHGNTLADVRDPNIDPFGNYLQINSTNFTLYGEDAQSHSVWDMYAIDLAPNTTYMFEASGWIPGAQLPSHEQNFTVYIGFISEDAAGAPVQLDAEDLYIWTYPQVYNGFLYDFYYSKGIRQAAFETPDQPVRMIVTVNSGRSSPAGDDAYSISLNTDYDALGDDFIVGDAHDNGLFGLRGEDTIDGGDGIDAAVYWGNSDAFTISFEPSITPVNVTDRSGREGSDLLMNMELAQFADDKIVALGIFDDGVYLTEAEFRSFTEMYIAYFNRAPDAEGLLFWADAFATGTSMPEIAEFFALSAEAQAAFPNSSSNADFVSTVYDNVLGRQPDAAGSTFWNQVLDNNSVSRSQFVLEILKGARATPPNGADAAFVAQQQADQKFLDDKIDIGLHFSAWLGMSDVANATSVMNLFDGSDTSKFAARDASLADFADAEMSNGSGELLFQLRGVFDDPFAVA